MDTNQTQHGFKFHPASEWFPLLGKADLAELAQDIKTNGLLQPIAVFKGEVLDGRNRLAACTLANARIRTIDLPDDTDPVGYVVSHNVMRRHLMTSQRALIAARMANSTRERREDEKIITASEAAQIMRVSKRSVETARTFLNHASGPLIEMVEKGFVAVSAANAISSLSASRQLELVQQGPSSIVAESHRQGRSVGGSGRAEYAVIWDRFYPRLDEFAFEFGPEEDDGKGL